MLIPVETGYFSMQGAVRQEATIEMLARRAGHDVRFRVLGTMYDVRTKLAREILSELKRHFADKLLPVVINFNSKLKEAASFGQPITEYDAASRGMQDFDKRATGLLSNAPTQPCRRPVACSGGGPTPPLTARGRAGRTRLGPHRTLQRPNAKLTADPDIAARARDRAHRSPPRHPSSRRPANFQERLSKIYGVRSTSQGLLFVQPAPDAKKVSIAGDFNDWSATATPLKHDERLSIWQACVPLPPGRYRYRVVIDGEWVQDSFNSYVETNPFGELNSVVEVVS